MYTRWIINKVVFNFFRLDKLAVVGLGNKQHYSKGVNLGK